MDTIKTIFNISGQVGCRYNIPKEELYGEGYLAFCKYKSTYKKKKGSLEKHLTLRIRLDLVRSAKKIKKEISLYSIEAEKLDIPVTVNMPFDYLSQINLSKDALEIINIIQEIPDSLSDKLNRNRKNPKTIFEEYLRKEKAWKHQRIWNSFRELRSKFRRG